jgi:N-acyl-D-amino-acid deacylase
MSKILSRRDFLRDSARAAAALSAAVGGPASASCAAGRYDLIVRGAMVYDGTGAAGRPADIGIIGDRIAKVGRLSTRASGRVVDARGLAAAPGFIDIHDHSAEGLLVDPRAESAVRQGVTTLIGGNCGESVFPLTEETAKEMGRRWREEFGLDLSWRDAAGFFGRLEASGLAVNYGSLVGHGSVRAAVMGYGNRRPKEPELADMKDRVMESLRQGALGLSSGLEYTPGSFAAEDELVELCRTTGELGGFYATHMRDEEDGVLEALDEAIRIARAAGVPLQVSHFKVGYASNWPKFDSLLARIEAARREGLDILCDRYPYTAWATGLSTFFPLWAREGETRDFIARLKDPALDERLRSELAEQERKLGGWDRVLISSAGSERHRSSEGKSILDLAMETGKDPYAYIRDLLVDEEGRVGMITFAMSEDHLRRLMAHPLVGVGADGSAMARAGPLSKGHPHPRICGTFPRALGRYVREEKLVPLEEMLRKLTSMPARRLGLEGRGEIKNGAYADLVLFDPERVADRATWADPQQYPVGIEYVAVNGQIVVENEEHTGRRPGRVLRKTARPR